MIDVFSFMEESNRIEGIVRPPTSEEVAATKGFLRLEYLEVDDLINLVKVYQPNAVPRFEVGLDVRVGQHVPPRGGPEIRVALETLLRAISTVKLSPFNGHCEYETLHPFTDGNGRSGRTVWLWSMGGVNRAPLGFLHTFYYQSLQNIRKKD